MRQTVPTPVIYQLTLCRRACIQEWAADELLSYSLADMLVMNDRMHAELQRWEHVTQSLVLTQRMPMVSVPDPALRFTNRSTQVLVHSCHRPLAPNQHILL